MQRRNEPHDSLDYFPTPAWGTRALCEHVLKSGPHWKNMTAWDPACGEGHMAKPLAEYFGKVIASDIFDYGFGYQGDFLFENRTVDFIITNPPFRMAEQFIAQSCRMAEIGVCMLVRSAFLESVGRYENLFSKNPPSIIAQFCERLPMVKGRVDKDASSATAYSWVVWLDGEEETKFVWIPPCRKQLERPGDYDLNSSPNPTLPRTGGNNREPT
jgi:hypothetical protein